MVELRAAATTATVTAIEVNEAHLQQHFDQQHPGLHRRTHHLKITTSTATTAGKDYRFIIKGND